MNESTSTANDEPAVRRPSLRDGKRHATVASFVFSFSVDDWLYLKGGGARSDNALFAKAIARNVMPPLI